MTICQSGCIEIIKIKDSATTSTSLNKDLEILYNDMAPNENIKMGGKTKGQIYLLSLCLGEKMNWIEENSKSDHDIETAEAMIYKLGDITETCEYANNKYYKGITIAISTERFEELKSNYDFEKNIFRHSYGNFEKTKFSLPIESKVVINQILDCPYDNGVKNMYLEAKSIELLSICLNRVLERDHRRIDHINLSRSELESIYKAKEVLDKSLSTNMSISKLSKLVYLNEFKLKTGFKEIFGRPVHTYLIEKRMELARSLLEANTISVTEVSHMVGYSNSSSFFETFRKTAGFFISNYNYKLKNLM